MKNKKTVFKAFMSYEKELAYINKMNNRGWKLVSIRFSLYTFVRTEPNRYMTVCHFADRQYQSTFIRTVTECGCEIAHHTSAGLMKFIMFYINVPVGYEKADFLTDNQSKLEFNKRLSVLYKRSSLTLFAVMPFTALPTLMSIPITKQILRAAPDDPYPLMKEYLFGYIGNAACIIGGIICGIMGAYALYLYFKTKKTIKQISKDMRIFE